MIFRKENKYEKKLKFILTFQKYLEYVWKVFGKFFDNICKDFWKKYLDNFLQKNLDNI